MKQKLLRLRAINKKAAAIIGGVVLTAAAHAEATGPDFTSLTSAVDFSTVGTAVLAIAALIAVPLVVKKGARMVLSMIGR